MTTWSRLASEATVVNQRKGSRSAPTAQQKSPESSPRLPGRDPDYRANLERAIKIGWSLVGIVMTGGIFTWYMHQRNMFHWPTDELGWIRLAAVAAATVNVAIWMWFPLDDLGTLRYWVRTRKRMFPGRTGEFLAIMFQMVLLLSMILGASAGALLFGATGLAVYCVNTVGFVYLRQHLRRALDDSRALYSEQGPEIRPLLIQALHVIEKHWTTEDSGLRGWQQKRHLALTLGFAGVVLLSLLPDAFAQILAYGAGILAIVTGEVVITVQRIRRDNQLHLIEEELGLEAA